jgi:hypothetical protein
MRFKICSTDSDPSVGKVIMAKSSSILMPSFDSTINKPRGPSVPDSVGIMSNRTECASESVGGRIPNGWLAGSLFHPPCSLDSPKHTNGRRRRHSLCLPPLNLSCRAAVFPGDAFWNFMKDIVNLVWNLNGTLELIYWKGLSTRVGKYQFHF